jgi:aerobic carbon-monoxide dehydrogenase medium subunit
VRNMGTIGGALAFADPGLDYPPALVAADAQIEIAASAGPRRLPAREFFLDWYTTALQPGELVAAVILPRPSPGYGRYHKLARVAGDYATVSIALAAGAGNALRIAVGACGPAPIARPEVDALLSADRSPAAVVHASQLLVEHADPIDDVRGSAEYRRMVIPRLLASAVQAYIEATRP